MFVLAFEVQYLLTQKSNQQLAIQIGCINNFFLN